jgi:lipopolysaccharide/colanic/teichoic acid biosynthesis glycosyltransferase
VMVSAGHSRIDMPAPVAVDAETAFAPPRLYMRVKAGVDFGVALILFALTLPLVLLAMALVRLTSRGPAIYSQTRLGKNGRPFTMYKLRTMTHDAEKNGARWSLPGDSRVTALGRWLRKTHVDELPQLWNVLKGEMSLVGPRPERPEFVPQLEQAIVHYRKRLAVRPGVTGLAQVQLPPDSDLDSVRVKLAFDLHYARHAGVWLDLRICWATCLRLLGFPFGLLRKVFRFPPRETVEADYQALCAAPPVAKSIKNHAPMCPSLS